VSHRRGLIIPNKRAQNLARKQPEHANNGKNGKKGKKTRKWE
jgi:hypothetical protein